MYKILSILSFICMGAINAWADESNFVYIDALEAKAGEELTLQIKMRNEVFVSGYQFDLVLPGGTSVLTDEEGFPYAELSTVRTTSRKTDYFNSCLQAAPNILRILCYSSNNYTFSGNDGVVATVEVKVPDTMMTGDYEIRLENIVLSYIGTTYKTPLTTATIHIDGIDPAPEPSGLWGDLNNDGEVTIADVNALIDYLLQKK